MSNKAAYHHITQSHGNCFILLAAHISELEYLTVFVTQHACSVRISRLSQSWRRNASPRQCERSRDKSRIQCPDCQVVACSTLRHISTCISIAVCVHLALSRTMLPPPPPNDCGNNKDGSFLLRRERLDGRTAAVEPKRQMCPCRCVCVHLSLRLEPWDG